MRVEEQKCRRADNMIFGIENGGREREGLRGNLETANFLSLFRGMSLHASDQSWGRLARGEVAASRHKPPTCKSFAKCRRADISKNGKLHFGVAE
jgi:hypothetical protein